MKKDDIRYKTYIKILEEELVPAFGCTEPIALAYAAARAREVLGDVPDRVVLQVSGSIIKNVKSVIVPNTNHLKASPPLQPPGSSREILTKNLRSSPRSPKIRWIRSKLSLKMLRSRSNS